MEVDHESNSKTAGVEMQVDQVLTIAYTSALAQLESNGPIVTAAQAPQDHHMTTQEEEEEPCTICYTSELSADVSVTLACGHRFHTQCIKQLLSHKWSTLKIQFSFLQCPSCKQDIRSDELQSELEEHLSFKSQVEQMAVKVAQSQGLDKDERYLTGDYKDDLLGFAMHSCSFYQCHGCKKAYFGGMIDCQAALGLEESSTTKEDLLCKDCQLEAFGAGDAVCNDHGTQHIEWKCLFCCSVAVFFCYGTHYFCKRCHAEYETPPKLTVELRDCDGANCPLGVPHPRANPNYKLSTFPIGCSLCKSEKRQRVVQVQEVCLEPIVFKAATSKKSPTYSERVKLERLEEVKMYEESKELYKNDMASHRQLQAEKARAERAQALQAQLNAVKSRIKTSPVQQSAKARPQTAAAEAKRLQIIAKREEIAARKQAALQKQHELREAKIAALNAKHAQMEDAKAIQLRKKMYAEKLKNDRVRKQQQTTTEQQSKSTTSM